MRKTFITIFTLLVCSTAILAQEHKEQQRPSEARQPAAPNQPPKYTSTEGRYSVAFPDGAQPNLTTQNITDPYGNPVLQYMAMVIDGNDAYMVAYFDFGPNIVFNLDKARDGMVNSLKGTLVEEHSMSLAGAGGREIRIAARTEQGMEFIDLARFFNVSPRVYVLQCLYPKANDGASMAQRCAQFLDSFRVRTTP